MSHRLAIAILGLAVAGSGCTLVDGLRTDHQMNCRAKKAWDRYENCYDDTPNEDEIENGFYEGYLQYVYHGCGNAPKCLPSRFNRPSYQTCFGKGKAQAYRDGFQLGVEAASHDCQSAGTGGRSSCSTGRCGGPTCATGNCRAAGHASGGYSHPHTPGHPPGGHCPTCEAGYPGGVPTDSSVFAPEGAWHGPPLSEGMIIPPVEYPSGDAKPGSLGSDLAPPPEPANDLPMSPPKDSAPKGPATPSKDGATPPPAPATSDTVPYGTPYATQYGPLSGPQSGIQYGNAPSTPGSSVPDATLTTSPRSFGPRVIGPDEVLPPEEPLSGDEPGATTLPELTVPNGPPTVRLSPPSDSASDEVFAPSTTTSPTFAPQTISPQTSAPPTSSAARTPAEGWRPARRTLNDDVAPFPEAGRETLKR